MQNCPIFQAGVDVFHRDAGGGGPDHVRGERSLHGVRGVHGLRHDARLPLQDVLLPHHM